MPFEPKMHRPCDEWPAGEISMDVSDLPDDLAALATQLADDAAMLAATYSGAPSATFAKESRDVVETREAIASLEATDESTRDRLVRTAWSWTRVAALFVIAAGATSAAIWQWQIRQLGSQAGIVDNIVDNIVERAAPVVASPVVTANMSSSPADTEGLGVPTVISLEVAVGLSGEKIEVLADAFAAAAVEI